MLNEFRVKRRRKASRRLVLGVVRGVVEHGNLTPNPFPRGKGKGIVKNKLFPIGKGNRIEENNLFPSGKGNRIEEFEGYWCSYSLWWF
jgi:hypothetical protein